MTQGTTIGIDADCSLRLALPATAGRQSLIVVSNPYRLLVQQGTGILEILDQDPRAGEEMLQGASRQISSLIERARAMDVAGIAYCLAGASPDQMSPMAYGGHFLERDRELLRSAEGMQTLLLVLGGDGAYLDVLSDLPADVFGWDLSATGVGLDEMKQMRHGLLASSDPRSDFVLRHRLPLIEELEALELGTAV